MTSETHQLHIRRVVTGTDDAGEAVILSDGDAPAVTTLPQVPGTALVDLWRDDALPPDLVGTADPTAGDFELMPAGTLFRIIDLAPSDAEPMWHQTPSIDFVYVAQGSCTFLYPGGAVELAGGDSIVVRGIRHAWANRGQQTCRLIDASVGAPS